MLKPRRTSGDLRRVFHRMVTRGTKPQRSVSPSLGVGLCPGLAALEERPLERDPDSSRVPFGALRDRRDLAERHRAYVRGDDFAVSQLQAELSETLLGPPRMLVWAFRWVGNQQASSQGEQRSGAFRCCRRGAEAPSRNEFGLVTVRASGNQLGSLADDLDPARGTKLRTRLS